MGGVEAYRYMRYVPGAPSHYQANAESVLFCRQVLAMSLSDLVCISTFSFPFLPTVSYGFLFTQVKHGLCNRTVGYFQTYSLSSGHGFMLPQFLPQLRPLCLAVMCL